MFHQIQFHTLTNYTTDIKRPYNYSSKVNIYTAASMFENKTAFHSVILMYVSKIIFTLLNGHNPAQAGDYSDCWWWSRTSQWLMTRPAPMMYPLACDPEHTFSNYPDKNHVLIILGPSLAIKVSDRPAL